MHYGPFHDLPKELLLNIYFPYQEFLPKAESFRQTGLSHVPDFPWLIEPIQFW